MLAGESSAVVTLPFENAPEALHRTVVNAMRHSRHTLGHAGLNQIVVKCAIRVLKASVAVKERVCVGIGLYCPVEGLEHNRIVIMLSNRKGHDAPVTEVKYGTEIYLVNLNALIPLEFRNIGQPLLVWLIRKELTVQQILCKILRIFGLPRTAEIRVLNGGFYISGTTDTKNPLVVDLDTIVVTQIVVNAAVALVRGLCMDILNLFGKPLILCRLAAELAGHPLVVG